MKSMVWIAWYPGDYMRDTGHLTLIEHGAYRVLLDAYYCTGSLPSAIERLYHLARAYSVEERAAVDAVVVQFFVVDGDRLRHKRADAEIMKRARFAAERSETGKRGANKRWHGSANGPAIARPQSQPQEEITNNSTSDPVGIGRELAEYFLTLVRKIKPDLRQPSLAAWARHCDRMVRLDGRDPERIRGVMTWVTNDKFWQRNVLSPEKLREKFDQLEMAMRGEKVTNGCSAEQRDKYAGLDG